MNYRLAAFDAMCNGTGIELLIAGVALIDRSLRNVLESRLKNATEVSIFNQRHALSDYSHRSEMCRALDLIDNRLWQDLEAVRKMRNDAAHLNTSGTLSLCDQTFVDRISLLHEIRSLRQNPELLQEDRASEKRTGVLYEWARSQLLWSLTEILCKLDRLAPTPSSELPPQKYQLGDQVEVKLTTDPKVSDLNSQSEAVGTIVATLGGIFYNVRIDNPPDPNYNTLTYLTDEYITGKL